MKSRNVWLVANSLSLMSVPHQVETTSSQITEVVIDNKSLLSLEKIVGSGQIMFDI